jgi:hypothetical protein
MTKAEFIDSVAEKAQVPRDVAARVVEAIFDVSTGAVEVPPPQASELSQEYPTIIPPENPTLRELAEFVWDTPDEAERWLRAPHMMLGGETPLAFASTPAGEERVKQILWAIEYSLPA